VGDDTKSTSAPEAKGSWFSALAYDPFLWLGERAGMAQRRRRLLSTARGRVLELGAGTGLNLPHYPERVERLVLAEPEEHMVARLKRRRDELGRSAEIVSAPAEALPFDDESFDTVVSTMVLCTVADPQRALAEAHRVLASGGNLLFVEHVRADDERLARWQDRLQKPWESFADGCICNRRTLELLRGEGFDVTVTERGAWRRMPPIVRPLVAGRAVRA
jgi:ubiquinone/menaquinone biosynthesis C-methylase UbiE